MGAVFKKLRRSKRYVADDSGEDSVQDSVPFRPLVQCGPDSDATSCPKPSGANTTDVKPCIPGIVQHGSDPSDATVGHPFRGVSVEYLCGALRDEVKALGLPCTATIYQIELPVIRQKGKNVVCPRDRRKGAAYVDCIRGVNNAGLASSLLSYSWGYTVDDIAETLGRHCLVRRLTPSQYYLWICCLCINQHRVIELQAKGQVVPFDEFKSVFAERVQGIGHIVAMMSPWRNPLYIQRVWCCFEMFTALNLDSNNSDDKHNVTIVMPPLERESLGAALMSSQNAQSALNEVWLTLTDLKVQDSKASFEDDRIKILRLIETGPGYHKINSEVAKRLQIWIVDTAEDIFQQSIKGSCSGVSSNVSLCDVLGELLIRVGLYERAMIVLEQGLTMCRNANLFNTRIAAVLLRRLGIAHREQGHFAKALELCGDARNILQNLGILDSVDGAELLSSMGYIEFEQGHLHNSLLLYAQARRIMESTRTLASPMGILLLRNIGSAHYASGDRQQALEAYELARRIHEDTGTLATPIGAFLLTSIGTVFRESGELERALDLYHRSLVIREQTNTLETSFGAELLRLVGIANREQGHLVNAVKLFEKARKIRQRTGTLETPDGADLLTSIGFAECELGNVDNALIEYSKALVIRENTGSLQTGSGALLLQSIGSAKAAKGDREGALVAYEDAHKLYQKLGATQTPSCAWLLTCMGQLSHQMGKGDIAMKLYRQARQIREETDTLNAPYGAYLLALEGKVRAESGELNEAASLFAEAYRIRVATGTLETADGMDLLKAWARLELQSGNRQHAEELRVQVAHLAKSFGGNPPGRPSDLSSEAIGAFEAYATLRSMRGPNIEDHHEVRSTSRTTSRS